MSSHSQEDRNTPKETLREGDSERQSLEEAKDWKALESALRREIAKKEQENRQLRAQLKKERKEGKKGNVQDVAQRQREEMEAAIEGRLRLSHEGLHALLATIVNDMEEVHKDILSTLSQDRQEKENLAENMIQAITDVLQENDYYAQRKDKLITENKELEMKLQAVINAQEVFKPEMLPTGLRLLLLNHLKSSQNYCTKCQESYQVTYNSTENGAGSQSTQYLSKWFNASELRRCMSCLDCNVCEQCYTKAKCCPQNPSHKLEFFSMFL